MATRQRTSTGRRTSTRSSPKRAASRSSGAGGSRPKRSPADQPARSGPLRYLFDGHGHDLWGVLLIIVAVLVGIAVYSGSAGAVGAPLRVGTATLVGLLRFLVPPALAAVGVLLIRGPRRPGAEPDGAAHTDDPTEELPGAGRHRGPVRVAGVVLALLVVAGLADLLLAEGMTVEADGWDAYAGGGGLLGALLGSLGHLIGRWGAVVVLLLLGVVAVSLVTGRSLRHLAAGVVSGTAPLLRSGAEWFGELFKLRGDHLEDADGDAAASAAPTVQLYDQDHDAPAPAPRRRRKKAAAAPDGPAVVAADPNADGAEAEQLQIDMPPGAAGSPWRLPPKSLLAVSGRRSVDTAAVEERGRVLEGALAEHGVETRLVGMVVGPTVTRYELELGVGVKVARITSLHRDIAYAMASPDVRILAPIPGRQAIGVEVPNEDRQVVALGDILTSAEAHAATHPLEVAVGRDIGGASVLMNLATMPHLLIAGQTGAGKSSGINSIITSILMRSTPEQVRMILVDPKQVELTQYNKIPHLLTQVVTNPKKAANALNWAVKEMERRYDLLSEAGVRDITGYNAAFDRGELQAQLGEDREPTRLPFILVVVDELADLMMVASRDVEESITRIAAKARAVGIHLVIATQRPSVNVITGVIKANIPARLAFAVASATDSKVILDQLGAERLVGRGDMLLLGGGTSVPQRIQGAWVEETEVAAVVGRWRKQTPSVEDHYVEGVADEEVTSSSGGGGGGAGGDEDDELLAQAMELVVRSGLGSTSMLQRKLKVGFSRAGRLMDLLEQRGVVGPSEGSKARTVLLTPDELDAMIEAGEV